MHSQFSLGNGAEGGNMDCQGCLRRVPSWFGLAVALGNATQSCQMRRLIWSNPGPRILPHLFNLVRSCQLWQIHLSQLLVPLLLAAQKDIDAAKRHPKYPKSASRTETQRRACELQDVDSPDE